MSKNKIQKQEEPVVEVVEVVETVEVVSPVLEVKEEVKEEIFNTNSFKEYLSKAVVYYTEVYGNTKSREAAEVAKTCGIILSKLYKL